MQTLNLFLCTARKRFRHISRLEGDPSWTASKSSGVSLSGSTDSVSDLASMKDSDVNEYNTTPAAAATPLQTETLQQQQNQSTDSPSKSTPSKSTPSKGQDGKNISRSRSFVNSVKASLSDSLSGQAETIVCVPTLGPFASVDEGVLRDIEKVLANLHAILSAESKKWFETCSATQNAVTENESLGTHYCREEMDTFLKIMQKVKKEHILYSNPERDHLYQFFLFFLSYVFVCLFVLFFLLVFVL